MYSTSLPKKDILPSKDWSKPEMSVPMIVTEKIPMTIPRVVRKDLNLLELTEK
tara:strand:- start:425 stop:583 length:159 start_codon:yes stop_codon:yes gene_type:complete